MSEEKLHPILARPHEYDLIDFRYRIDRQDSSRSFIDMTLEHDVEVVTLRFWRPVNLKIEEGFPQPTRGMVFYDLSSSQLEGIGVEVSDFEASTGAITFSASSVERVQSMTD